MDEKHSAEFDVSEPQSEGYIRFVDKAPGATHPTEVRRAPSGATALHAFAKETAMHDMFGFAMLFELSSKDGRRKHEFDHLIEKHPLRARLRRIARLFRLMK